MEKQCMINSKAKFNAAPFKNFSNTIDFSFFEANSVAFLNCTFFQLTAYCVGIELVETQIYFTARYSSKVASGQVRVFRSISIYVHLTQYWPFNMIHEMIVKM